MLERIEKIEGIGLLHKVNGKGHTFGKATLIYADNGRGKSTLASVFRAASQGASDELNERRTLDGTLSPAVKLNFSNGISSVYENGLWSRAAPEIVVFDGKFIDDNVHSGGTVGTLQRKNLLQFALGTAAVTARKEEEKATAEASKASETLKQLVGRLAGYQAGMSLSVFEKLTPINDAEEKIAILQKRLAVAGNASEIHRRPLPHAIEYPPFDLDAFFGILQTSLEDIQEDAENLVRAHLNQGGVGIENWLSAGKNFDNGESCPYCAQDTKGVDLIRAYRTHFNAAYTLLKSKVSQLKRGIEVRLNDQILEAFSAYVIAAQGQFAAWSNEVNLAPINFDAATATAILRELRLYLVALAEKKENSPPSAVGSDSELVGARIMWDAVLSLMNDVNKKIVVNITAVEVFKKTLALEQPAAIQSKINTLLVTKRRFEPEPTSILAQITAARASEAACSTAKKKAREQLDIVMSATLGAYEKSINQLLAKFGASFRIEKLDANFRGGAPRTEYGINLRGKSLLLDSGTPKFNTALSDGDKRTLAFAFFIATNLAAPHLSTSIIIVDDPMCSLDKNRRQHTRTVLKILSEKAKQLIVLAHDSFFVRDLRSDLASKDGQWQVQILQLSHAENDYSGLNKFDVDVECESPYYRHHRMLSEFVEGKSVDVRSVAKALRPFLEAYIHRRFPRCVPAELMFGHAISYIRDTAAPNPVIFAHSLVEELLELNGYAGQFHHDTNPDTCDGIAITSAELKAFCQRALHLTHSGQAMQ